MHLVARLEHVLLDLLAADPDLTFLGEDRVFHATVERHAAANRRVATGNVRKHRQVGTGLANVANRNAFATHDQLFAALIDAQQERAF